MAPDRHGGRTSPGRPDRSTAWRGAAAVIALVAGVACLAAAAVMLVRQATDARSGTPVALPPPIDTMPEPTTTAPVPITSTNVDLSGMVEIVDDSGTLSVFVPESWSDVATSGWTSDGLSVGVRINAAPDRAAWFEGWSTPGVFVGATTFFDAEDLGGDFGGVCSHAGRRPFASDVLSGTMDTWADCSDEGSELLVVVAAPGDRSYVVLIQVIAIDESDRAGFDAVVSTVRYRP